MTLPIPHHMVDDQGWANNAIIDPGFTIWPQGTPRTSVADGTYGSALWKWGISSASGNVDISQDTDVPSGSKVPYSLKVDVTGSETTFTGSELARLRYQMTGYDLAPLWGETVAFTFWVKAVKTGIYCVSFQNADASYSYVQEFTVSSASTWEQKTVTVPLTESAGTWNFDANVGLQISIVLGAGVDVQGAAGSWNNANDLGTSNQVNGLDSGANNFWIHAPQLHVGTVALPFTMPPQGVTEAAFRYYFRTSYDLNVAPGTASSLGAQAYISSSLANQNTMDVDAVSWGTNMRAIPTVTIYSPNDGSSGVYYNITDAANQSAGAANVGKSGFMLRCSSAAGMGTKRINWHYGADARH